MKTSETERPCAVDLLYPTGKVLHLEASANGTSNQQQETVQVKIRQQKRPWTLSCGMVVEEIPGSPTDTVSNERFLKMFDRRGAQQLRRDNQIDKWSENIENELVNDLKSGKVEEFLEKLKIELDSEEDTEEDSEEEWDAAENEAYLSAELQDIFEAEVATYARLKEYQGKLIPRFLSAVTLDICSSNAGLTAQQQELYRPKGVLLQYLHGFSLSTMPQCAPESSWQGIVDQAIKIVHILGDHEILNDDVRPDNFVVVSNNGTYQVFMIDFGQCRFRREDESDEESGRAKWSRDEEGAVGVDMKMRLGKIGFDLRYEPSLRYLAWAPADHDELLRI